MKQRLSDSSNVYVEERYQDIDSASGLTHATGVTLAPDDRWNIGANAEVGTLVDSQTDAQTKRKAGGIRVGYGRGRIQVSSGIEYRDDEMQQPNATTSKLKTRLFRNNLDRKSTRLNSSHGYISYAVFCLKKKKDTY